MNNQELSHKEISSRGGKRAAANMSKEARIERARKAVQTRWAKIRELKSQN